ncbi:unnamed protein product [Rotaria sp. Silwood1]|nr:unnamed protein product [Rotaria sp. Silwood1]CAF1063575.1 unnamed protein product [Rotaria sp. Silwood1]CAF3432291.1 unnamed protein product [Rotaria sp. Silwood1]CAF4524473.1 unnamed protein product [Rotaria sp. Silwood1]
MKNFSILSRDDLSLAYYDWLAKNCNLLYGLLIVIHGISEHSGQYENLIEFYNFPHIFGVTVKDFDTLISVATPRYTYCPTVLHGHSMGETLVLSYTFD